MNPQTSPVSSAKRFARETSGNVAQTTQHAVEEHPFQVSLCVFAAGLAAGTLLGCALASGSRRSEKRLAENLGARLLDGMNHVVPDRLAKKFGG